MKVLEVNVDDNGMGGVYSLVRNIIINRPQDAIVDIAALEEFENPQNVRDLADYRCSVHYVGRSGSKLLKQLFIFRNVRNLVKRGGYDAVHIHSDVSNKLLVSALASKAAGCKKVILHSHSSGVEGNHRTEKRLIHFSCRKLLKYIGTDFLTCSDLAAKWMFPNVEEGNIVTIKNGIDLDKFQFSELKRSEQRTRLGVKDELLVGHVGRFAYQKNHEFLIEIFSDLLKTNASAKLLLVGEGCLMNDIKEKVSEMGLSKSVIFYGISHSVCDLFQAMDVFVLPSRFEGLPIVGVEAQASGLPCIFSDRISRETDAIGLSSFLPISQEAKHGWAEAILRSKAQSRAEAAQKMQKAGFSIKDTVDKLWSVYIK